MLATPQEALHYLTVPEPPPHDSLLEPLREADSWVRGRVEFDAYAPVPKAVSAATALLAALFAVEPEARGDDASIPKMVWLMILPWAT